jgi:hypothetical protein
MSEDPPVVDYGVMVPIPRIWGLSRIRIILCSIDANLARARCIERGVADADRERFHPDPAVQAAREGRQLPIGEYDPPR